MKVSVCCHICKNKTLQVVRGYDYFPQVTSDCKLWRGRSSLVICQTCGSVQKITDHAWSKDAQSIYSNYTLYHQANGKEQAVFDINSGKTSRRSESVLQYVETRINLKPSGRYMDLGCGSGNALRYFSGLRPRWLLSGAELSSKFRKEVESISKRVLFYSCPLKRIPGRFNLITMFHLLEHIIDPVHFLVEVRDKLASDGFLVIDVPDYRHNPFDLFVTDHCMHFTMPTLRAVLFNAGFEIDSISSSLIPKELVVIARKKREIKGDNCVKRLGAASYPLSHVACALAWVKLFLERAKKLSEKDNFGIFGTSITATWLMGRVGGRVRFFVDEDPCRQGRSYLGVPVYHPQDIPNGSNVFLALPFGMAKKISKRLSRKESKFYLPPLKERSK